MSAPAPVGAVAQCSRPVPSPSGAPAPAGRPRPLRPLGDAQPRIRGDTASTSGVVGASAGDQTVPFHGPHQAGVATPPQAYLALLGLDLDEPAATPRPADATAQRRHRPAHPRTPGSGRHRAGAGRKPAPA